jgi:hypothetical protein
MLNIAELEQNVLNEIFSSNVLPRVRLLRSEEYNEQYTKEELELFSNLTAKRFTVVGIDIYRYSLFPTEKQIFIPHLFELVYQHSWDLIRENFSYLFQHHGKVLNAGLKKEYLNPNDYFISTGDGGFQILETPIHAILFLLTFSTILRFYNSDLFMRSMYAKIGNIDVRYAVTHGDVYKFRNNYYGSAIINNARMLARDRLNRLLLDKNSYEWFLRSIAGIENLMSINLDNISEIDEFKDYDESEMDSHNALIIPQIYKPCQEGIRSVDIQKIGRMRQKMTSVDIYNLHIQAVIDYKSLFGSTKTITVSVGNLNVSGIESEEI